MTQHLVAVVRSNGIVGSSAVVLVDAGSASDHRAKWRRILVTGQTRPWSQAFADRYNATNGAELEQLGVSSGS